MDNENPFFISESPPRVMRLGRFLFVSLFLGAFLPALSLVHTVTDFRSDSSVVAGERFKLDEGWGDSLLLAPESFRYMTVKTIKLSDGKYNNGDAGSSPVGATPELYNFKVAYLSWKGATHDNGSSPSSKEAPRANIVIRNIDLSPDTAAIGDSAKIIAGQEINPQGSTQFIYSNGPPAPTYLSFGAEGNQFAAYWGSGTPNGPIRRTTHKDSKIGYYVPNNITPIGTGGFGKMSSALVPGSGGTKTVLAYETNFAANRFQVRWEDITAGTSEVSVDYNRTIFPEDFAVASDSSGNSLVLWREDSALYAVAFDLAHAQIQPPTLIRAGIAYKDSIEHLYRPYAVVSLTRGNFLIAYAEVTGLVSNIWTIPVALPLAPQAWSIGAAAMITYNNHYSLFPDLAVTADRTVVGWFQRPSAGAPNGARRLMGSIVQKSGANITLVGRTDLDLASENIGFAGMSTNWNRYHWFKSANVSMDAKGNVLAAYDSGTHAKVALVRNTPIYYDSASYVSRSFKVENPSIPAFVFNPATDSVQFLPFRPTTTDTLKTRLKLAISQTNTFNGAGSAFQSISMGGSLKASGGFYKYRVDLLTYKTPNPNTTNLFTPKLRSLDIEYNVKPALPVVDSIKPGSFPKTAYNPAGDYPLLPRKDSLKLVCSAFDADADGLEFRVSLGPFLLKAVNGIAVPGSPGTYVATLSLMPPDTVLNPLPLTLTTVDPGGWSSQPFPMLFNYSNIVPTQTLTVLRNRGRDSSNVYRPSGGVADTLSPVDGGLIVVQAGDSLEVKARYTDGNDNNVNASWFRNSVSLGARTLPTIDSVTFRYSPDTLDPQIDTLVAKVGDKDSTVTFRIPVRPNRIPSVDSVWHGAYKSRDSSWKTGPFDKVRSFPADTGLILPVGLMTVVQAAVADPDTLAGDTLAVKWKIWRQPVGCARGNQACYLAVDSAEGTALTRVFNTQEQFLTLRVIDASGAFRERRLWLEYPVLDTLGVVGFAAAVKSLVSDIDFVIDAEVRDTTVKAEIQSLGSTNLVITSVATKNNDRKWLDVKLEWLTGTPPRPDSVRFAGATNLNALTAGRTISLPPNARLAFNFRFSSDSLRGDSVLIDTLLVQTNDFANPILKIPFRLEYRDLPVVRLAVPGTSPAGPSAGYNAAGLPRLVPARSTISMAFSETVRILDPTKVMRVYSYLDSLKNPSGFRIIPGTYEYRRKPAGLGKISAFAADSLADTVVFTPHYDRVSDSLKVKPLPGFFIYRDVLHIALSNGITDKAGNGLDLRLNKQAVSPGTLDTVFQARVDSSYFKVVTTRPAQGEEGWNPETPIRIRFNRKLSRPPPAGTDTMTLLNLAAFRAEENHAVRVTSIYRPDKTYDFQFLSLENNDSTLVFNVRPRLPALDTVTVRLSGGILDTSGLSLDGDGDKFPAWLYGQQDSVDIFTFTFNTSDADFYVFPNPFRFSNGRHRDKGSITFKNLNSLRGYSLGDDVVLRVHTMTGDLVYNSETASGSLATQKLFTSLDWDLKNNRGSLVGSGVYLYTLTAGKSKLLTKGKVAIIRD
ncbi:MAG: hypothetical protein M3Y08_10575 [Fibrobacterota bacterium]|nr:hypothetical protein [Fibrobacterota bacterium]